MRPYQLGFDIERELELQLGLLPNTSSEKSVELVFSKKVVSKGLDQLKERIDLSVTMQLENNLGPYK